MNGKTNRHKAQEGNQNDARGTESGRDQCIGARSPGGGLQRGAWEHAWRDSGQNLSNSAKIETYRADTAYLTLTEHSIQPQQKHATFKVEYLAKIDLFGNREQFSNILKGFNSCNAYSLITVELNLNPIQERFLWKLPNN